MAEYDVKITADISGLTEALQRLEAYNHAFILAEVCKALTADSLVTVNPEDAPAVVSALIERCGELRLEVSRLERVEVEHRGTLDLVERLGLDTVLKGASSPAQEQQIRAWFTARGEEPRD